MKHPHTPHQTSPRDHTLSTEETDFEDDPGDLDLDLDLEYELEDELANESPEEDQDEAPIAEEQRQHPGS